MGLGLLLLMMLVVTGCTSVGNLLAVGDAYSPEYPQPYDKIFSPVTGSIDCKNVEGQYGAWGNDVFSGNVDNPWYGAGDYKYQWISCPDNAGAYGCQIKIYGLCQAATWYSSPKLIIYYDGQWRTFTTGAQFDLRAGENKEFRLSCSDSAVGTLNAVDMPLTATFSKRVPLTKLRVESYGYSFSGWLAGSEDCKLVSRDATTLKNLQPNEERDLDGIQQLRAGETKSITVGWREDPAFGNIFAKNGQKYVCRNLAMYANQTPASR